MKRDLGRRIMAGCMLAGLLFLSGCGSSSKGDMAEQATNAVSYATDDFYTTEAYDDAVADDVEYEENASADGGADILENGETKKSDRKLIKNVDMNVETTEFDSLVAKISQKVDALGGYIESSEVYGDGVNDSFGTRSAYYTLRIPNQKLDDFLETVAENSNITRKSENVEDVTLQYVDVESRKKSLQVEQQRLTELLSEAQDIDVIIVLESKLTEIRYQIESLESQLRTYDNQVDYSTVHVSVSEVEIYTPPKPESRWEKMVEGFGRSVQGVVEDVLDFLVGLVIILPYLVVWGILLFAFFFVVRLLVRKRKAKKEMKKKLQEQKWQEQKRQQQQKENEEQ